ncbi:uncharacterized protein LOC117647361 [Thrips palmi]|uniref:Uncharacterized protein LOC117647361 n=1 Tax=Thrips palmi TaxID=161013 RepID=A0A6P8Z4E8_THRPL|nr:uncharacterized protein LOC117647361 [Thrips palmi]
MLPPEGTAPQQMSPARSSEYNRLAVRSAVVLNEAVSLDDLNQDAANGAPLIGLHNQDAVNDVRLIGDLYQDAVNGVQLIGDLNQDAVNAVQLIGDLNQVAVNLAQLVGALNQDAVNGALLDLNRAANNDTRIVSTPKHDGLFVGDLNQDAVDAALFRLTANQAAGSTDEDARSDEHFAGDKCAPAEAVSEAVSEATPKAVSEATPEAVSEATPEAVSEATPEAVSEATPKAVPEAVPEYRSGDPTALRGDIFQRSKLEPAETPSPGVVTAAVTSSALPATPSTPAPTMTLLNLAENLISGFAVMVLQSQVHVDEPGAVEQKDEKAQNQLEDIFFKPEPMQFATPNNTVVVAQRGTTAYLPCVIKNIADGLVTWLRRRDHHLLTVARGGYAQDDRFQVVHDQHPEDWTMQLKFVTDRDAGRYECQVSTHPPVSNFIHLRVVEARCVIEGPAEKFVRSGSQLRLSCHIEQGTTEPEYMFWFKDGVMVNYDHQNIYQVTVDLPNNTTVLVVERATRAQSGNYTCEAAQAKSASNYVHVISGENPAAMQTGGVRLAAQPLWLTVLVLVAGARLAGLALG